MMAADSLYSRGVVALGAFPNFVRDDKVMLAGFLARSGRCFLLLVRADANFFQEWLNRLFATEKLLDGNCDVTRIAGFIDFMA